MTIAYLINQYPGISHTFIRREIEALERRGVAIARYAIRRSPHGVIADEDKREDAKTSHIVGGAPAALLRDAITALARAPSRSLIALVRAIAMGARSDAGVMKHALYWGEALIVSSWMRRDGARHIHAHFGTNSATVAMLAAGIAGADFSMTAHGPEEFDRPGLISLEEKIERAALVFGVSSFGVSQLRRLVGPAHWPKLRIAPCGVERAFWQGATPAPEGVARFVCVGRLCEQKGQLTLIEAAARLRKSGRDFHLTLVGDGEMRGEIEAAIRKFDLQDRITLAGWKTPTEVRALIEQSRVFVLPSYAEGLPVSIMEAMLVERPVISTYVAGIPELVRPGENGWLAPAGDADALAEAMGAAVDASISDIRAMGRRAHQLAFARHDIDAAAGVIAAAFAELQR
jgi:glycosyltransferase involved in cell wall biosynthesis